MENVGVIADLTVVLGPGMTVLTGETGAGKTLVVEAIELLLGARADAGLVRAGESEARVEARFDDVAGLVALGSRDVEDEIALDQDEVVLARVIPATGRSRAYVNGRMVPAATLAEVGRQLVDLHGQHSHHSLLSAAAQRAALDRFGGASVAAALAQYRDARARVRDLESALSEIGGDERERAREADLLRFQVEEIDAAAIEDAEEDERLAATETSLGSARAIREAAEAAYEELDQQVIDALGRASAVLHAVPTLENLEERLKVVQEASSEIARDIRHVAEAAEEDPARLEDVSARRRLLRELRRKYGEGLSEVLAFRHAAAARLDGLLSAEKRARELERAREEEFVRAVEHAGVLSDARRRCAVALASAIADELQELGMPSARVAIDVRSGPPGDLPEHGLDEVEILLAANPGEPPAPLTRVASGGELARTMLAARVLLSDGAPTLVFDEVDAGIGGQAGLAVGRRLGLIAREHQVLCVTHLAQVAAFANAHIAVEKAVVDARDGERTVAAAMTVDGERRVIELSRMLSGQGTEKALRHAEELLASASKDRS